MIAPRSPDETPNEVGATPPPEVGTGTEIDATNTANNGNLAPGQSATFGFQGTHDGSFESPTCTGN